MHPVATRRVPAIDRARGMRPLFPDGWLTPFLLVTLVTIAGLCVQQSDWSRLMFPVAVVAALGAVFGSVVARLRVLDSFAHMLSTVIGIGLSFVLVASGAATLEGSLRQRIREIGEVGLNWYLGDRVGAAMESLLVSLLMGIILWLVGYLAGWSLFRRGWIFAAIALPGFLILVNLGYAERPRTGYLAAFALVALVLIARHSLQARQREWNRLHLARSSGLLRGFMTTGIAMAVAVTAVGWQSPASLSQEALQPLIGEVSTTALTAQRSATEFLHDLSGSTTSGFDVSGEFSTFGSSFSVGGPLELTDTPQVLVGAERAPYLTAHHYDAYSGRGWYSTTGDSFQPEGLDGRRYSPAMTFAASQEVPLSPDVTSARTPRAIELSPLAPLGNQALTVDTFLSSSEQASVRMSWIQLDKVAFPLREVDISRLPRDLQRLASMLVEVELSAGEEEGSPAATDATMQDRIQSERQQLRERFLDVRWTADGNGNAADLVVSGQIPVYDDVESVALNEPVPTGGTYQIVASTSIASPEQLQGAGDAYPDWVQARYLSLSDTITPRTAALTRSITAASATPYDQARAIEQYLRSSIVYDETVDAPPDDVDIVDYLLFERQRGYCEYSATAMTVMLRSIGIPARVATGFYPGEYDQEQDGFVYRQNNAHAWTEVFFPQFGWIAFEPTSARPLIESGPASDPRQALPEFTPETEQDTPVPPTPTLEASPAAGSEDPLAPVLPAPTPASGADDSRWLWTAAGLGLLGALAGFAWLMLAAPLRGLSPAGAVFVRLRRLGRWLGVSNPPMATPREYGRAFAERMPQARQQVDRIVDTYELDQYGPERADARWNGTAEDAWQALKRQVPRSLWKHRG